jgi:hypothetical protein
VSLLDERNRCFVCGQDFGDLAPIKWRRVWPHQSSLKPLLCPRSRRKGTPLRPLRTPRKLRDSLIGFVYESINSNRCALIWSRKHTSRSPI